MMTAQWVDCSMEHQTKPASSFVLRIYLHLYTAIIVQLMDLAVRYIILITLLIAVVMMSKF